MAKAATGRRVAPTRTRKKAAVRPKQRAAAPQKPARESRGGETERPVPPGRRAAASESLGKYVYCIVQTKSPLQLPKVGIGAMPSDVHSIHYRDLAAVVSETPLEVHDPTRENVLAHERVNEMVMRKRTVLPMSFGTVFKTGDDIVELLRSAYDAFRDVLVQMHDKVEFGLKVLWDPEVIIREIEQQDEDVRRLKGEIGAQKGSTYFARMQYGRLLDAALQERSSTYVASIYAQLRDVAVATRSNKPIGDKMLLNAAFLVSRDKESAFDTRVKDIGTQYENLTFKYTGPWPPYNFVNIRLKLERAKDAD